MRQMPGLNELRERGRMTWIEQEHGWVAAPEEIMTALAKDGFEECTRETTSRRDLGRAGGAWRGIEPGTGSVASAIWLTPPAWHQAIVAGGVWHGANTRTGPVASATWADRPARDQAIVFIAIDGESLKGSGP
jgi:hypothetical protein